MNAEPRFWATTPESLERSMEEAAKRVVAEVYDLNWDVLMDHFEGVFRRPARERFVFYTGPHPVIQTLPDGQELSVNLGLEDWLSLLASKGAKASAYASRLAKDAAEVIDDHNERVLGKTNGGSYAPIAP